MCYRCWDLIDDDDHLFLIIKVPILLAISVMYHSKLGFDMCHAAH